MSKEEKTITAHPLCWPHGRPRNKYPEFSRFKTTLASARDSLIKEVQMLGGSSPIISTNIQVRQDGLPYANQREPSDSGIAVYFLYNKRQMCFACDRWVKVAENMQAISKTIEALRGIARWGTGDMLEAAFTGFTSLPSPETKKSWREVLGFVSAEVTLTTVERAYKELRSICHPDKGGSQIAFQEVQEAWEQAKKELCR